MVATIHEPWDRSTGFGLLTWDGRRAVGRWRFFAVVGYDATVGDAGKLLFTVGIHAAGNGSAGIRIGMAIGLGLDAAATPRRSSRPRRSGRTTLTV